MNFCSLDLIKLEIQIFEFWTIDAYSLIMVIDQDSGTHQILPRSPWLSSWQSSVLVKTFAATRLWLEGNILLNAYKNHYIRETVAKN